MSKKYTEAPYDEEGNLLEYPIAPFRGTVVWKPIEPFEDALRLVSMRRGRSAAKFIWKDSYGREYPMFLKDLLSLLTSAGLPQPGLTHVATWTVVKRGQNYGIAVVTEEGK